MNLEPIRFHLVNVGCHGFECLGESQKDTVSAAPSVSWKRNVVGEIATQGQICYPADSHELEYPIAEE
jgi:hypothetical protein